MASSVPETQLFDVQPGPVFLYRRSAQTQCHGVIAPCLPYRCPLDSEEEPPLPDGRLDVLAFSLLAGLDVQELRVVCTMVKAKRTRQVTFDVRLSELVRVSRVEC